MFSLGLAWVSSIPAIIPSLVFFLSFSFFSWCCDKNIQTKATEGRKMCLAHGLRVKSALAKMSEQMVMSHLQTGSRECWPVLSSHARSQPREWCHPPRGLPTSVNFRQPTAGLLRISLPGESRSFQVEDFVVRVLISHVYSEIQIESILEIIANVTAGYEANNSKTPERADIQMRIGWRSLLLVTWQDSAGPEQVTWQDSTGPGMWYDSHFEFPLYDSNFPSISAMGFNKTK